MGILQDIENFFGDDDSYNSYKSKIIQAQEQWNKDRDWIYKTERQGNYDTEFSSDLQPKKITTPDNYDSMELTTMQESVNSMSIKAVDDAVTGWANLGMALTGTFAQFQQQFTRTINGDGGHSGWRGAAAKAAVDAVNNYSNRSAHLQKASTYISLKLSEMKTGIEETRNLMPGVTVTTTPAGKTLPTDGVMKINDHNKDEATQEARRILNTVYGPVASQTDTGVPYLPTAPKIADSGPGPAASGPSGVSGPTVQPTNATGPSQSSGPAASGPSASGASGPGSDQTQHGGASGPSQTSSQQSTGPSDSANTSATGPQSTSTAGYNPNATQYTPNTADTSNYSGSGLQSTSSPTYSGTGNQPGSTSATPGRSIPGTSGTAQAAAAAERAAAAAARSGTSGLTGMGAPGQGKKSEDAEKSGVPDYLVTQEHGDQLTGLDEDRKYVPPVIGGDYDAPKY
ncbi:hypothetical protein [Nocardia macrotermitis]|uniref:Uncharacterized protein n=1 Tax=Nocardia macrotermitis TaxID=2585198 RepID=A0A7K0CY32_9NOCA|nr:hypothetical protein [Nocardia macrotermitis]MQY18341.1 hypothetical protein [Nocardia macrotermitis]